MRWESKMVKNFFIIILICTLQITGCSSTSTNSIADTSILYEKQLNLGYKFLGEGKYEEAIVTFNKAIEIDEKQVKAYIGLADTYVTRGGDNATEDANEALALGYQQTQSEEIVLAYKRLSEIIGVNFSEVMKYWFLQFGYEITKDESIRNIIETIINENSLSFMESLYNLCLDNDLDGIFDIMSTEEYSNLLIYATEQEPLFYSLESSALDKNGKGVGIYKNGNLYFGDYVNNERSGTGIWLGVVDSYYNYIFRGMWERDKPNGLGEVNKNWIDEQEDFKSGNLSNGLWDGDTYFEYLYEGEKVYYTLEIKQGKVTVLEVKKNDAGEDIFIIGETNDGSNVVTSEPNNLVDIPWGIMGFSLHY